MKLINLRVAAESHWALGAAWQGGSVEGWWEGGKEDGIIGLSGMAILFAGIPLHFRAAGKWMEKTAGAPVTAGCRGCKWDVLD